MATLAPRSPALRIVRNLVLLWVGLSLLGLVFAVVLSLYAMGWGCTADGSMRGGLSWGPCVLAYSVGILGAVTSLVCAVVVLLFAQLFYWAGADVKQGRPRRWWSREALLGEVLDAADIGEFDGDGGDGD
jgi:hypothetical protein